MVKSTKEKIQELKKEIKKIRDFKNLLKSRKK